MDFDAAVQAHAQWKMKLRTYIQHPDRSLDPAGVSRDNACALGQWLYGEGAKFSGLREYQELKRTHASFHRAAADIIRRCDAGEPVTDQVALGANSDYARCSTEIVGLIMALKHKAA